MARQAERLPSKDELLRFLAGSSSAPRTNELLKAFDLRSTARPALKRLLRELQEAGLLPTRRKPREIATEGLPAVGVVEIAAIDGNGDLRCQSELDATARILLPVEALDGKAPAVGDRVLVRFFARGQGRYDAHLMKLLPRTPKELVGVIETGGDGPRLRPLDRNARIEVRLAPNGLEGATPGDVVRVAVLPGRPLALPLGKVVERLGRIDDPKSISLSVAARHKLPMAFSDAALAQAGKAKPVALGKRKDLRDLPLVTIDGADARDFDDAVWATADDDPKNAGGHRIVVAIADVAHYVRPGDALDEEARGRGNSVYFPDRVIPMLPEALSNDLCSLRPEEDRACVAAFMRIDRQGRLIEHRFRRALMRSRARLTYERVQAARDGAPDAGTEPLVAPVIAPLYAAYEVLAAARRERGAIDLDLPERKILFDATGAMSGVTRRERLASHMLIEELMILANVAAASVLEEAVQPGLYRVHDKPDPARIEVLAEYLERIGVPWSRTSKRPGDFTALLERIQDTSLRETVAGFVLRCQAQAVYAPRNIGHFGLNLRRYAHFTSPIRRYSDLIVHRALIRVGGLGAGGLAETATLEDLAELGRHLSQCERRAMEAERAALERFVALYMAGHEGARFKGKITSVARFGLFVALEETGAEGLVPVSSLGDDMFQLDERHHALVGRRWGEVFGLGDPVTVELAEVDVATGSLSFRIDEHRRTKAAELARESWRRGGGGKAVRGRPTGRTRFRR